MLDAVRSHDPDDWSDDPRALRRASVASLARRCNSDVDAHARTSRELALELVRPDRRAARARRPRPRDARVRRAAARHRPARSRKGHHRHAAYLVENGELRGFEPAEVAFLAALVRHHRRGDPKSSEARFGALSADDRTRLRKLAALLRVADGLDRGRRGGVEDLEAFVGKDLVVIRLSTHDDAELELWGARRRRELFEKVFARELELVVGGSRVPVDV